MSSVWLIPVEAMLNRELGRRPSALAECRELDGQVLELDIRGLPALKVYVVAHPGGVQLLDSPPGEITASVQGTPPALLAMSRGEATPAAMRQAGVMLHGDTDFAARMQRLLRRAAPDVEAALARTLGGPAAHTLSRAVGGLGKRLQRIGDTLSRDTAEYFQFERGDLPTGEEVEDFLAEVDRLRDDVARLEARVRRLDDSARDQETGPRA